MLENHTTLEFREELKQEFNKWISITGVNAGNSPEKLRILIFEISRVFEEIREVLENRREIKTNYLSSIEQRQMTESFCQNSVELVSVERDFSAERPSKNGRKREKNSGQNDIEYNEQHLIDTLNNRMWGVKKDLWDCDKSAVRDGKNNFLNFSTSSEASFGVGGGLLSGGIGGSYYKYDEGDNSNVRVGGLSLGGEIGGGLGGITAGYSANFDLLSTSSHGFQTRIGPDYGSKFTAGPGGVEIKGAGFGMSIGKKMGFSTPLGEFSIDTEEACVVQ